LKKLCVYVPESHLDVVKRALFDAGAGRIGDYGDCCWQVLGQGQFRPLEGSAPFLGECGRLETVAEYRVEMLVADTLAAAVVDALRHSHPYEEPAWDLVDVTAPGSGDQ
jgi:hypothetical protein